jgi:hypothetical protein
MHGEEVATMRVTGELEPHAKLDGLWHLQRQEFKILYNI